jgi:hypothetical protein
MLGVTDSGIVIVRRALLEAIRAHAQSGAVPSVVLEPDLSMIRAVGIKLPPSENWWGDGTNNYMIAELGKGFGYEV